MSEKTPDETYMTVPIYDGVNEGQNTIKSIDRERKALELRRSGLTYDAISQEIGWTEPSAAHKAVKRAIKRSMQDVGEDVLELEVARLDRLMEAIWDQAVGGDLQCLDRVLKIAERRAKLLGIDAPARQHVEIEAYMGGTDIDREVEALAKTLARSTDSSTVVLEPAASEIVATPTE